MTMKITGSGFAMIATPKAGASTVTPVCIPFSVVPIFPKGNGFVYKTLGETAATDFPTKTDPVFGDFALSVVVDGARASNSTN